MTSVIADLELYTGLDTEETKYIALYSRDVNNYLAIKPDGTHKAKGAYAPAGLAKNPSNAVCVDAVLAYITSGVRIADTVADCVDVRKFITIRKVTGGGEKDGVFLGKAVRWYYAVGEKGTITYKTNGNTVARSEGARPLMELPDGNAVPADLDRGWYIQESYRILAEIGYKHDRIDYD